MYIFLKSDYVVSVLGLVDRFALENHDPKLGDTISDNLCEYTLYQHSL